MLSSLSVKNSKNSVKNYYKKKGVIIQCDRNFGHIGLIFFFDEICLCTPLSLYNCKIKTYYPYQINMLYKNHYLKY